MSRIEIQRIAVTNLRTPMLCWTSSVSCLHIPAEFQSAFYSSFYYYNNNYIYILILSLINHFYYFLSSLNA